MISLGQVSSIHWKVEETQSIHTTSPPDRTQNLVHISNAISADIATLRERGRVTLVGYSIDRRAIDNVEIMLGNIQEIDLQLAEKSARDHNGPVKHFTITLTEHGIDAQAGNNAGHSAAQTLGLFKSLVA